MIIGIVGGVIVAAIITAIVLLVVNSSKDTSEGKQPDDNTPTAAVDMAAVLSEIDARKVSDFKETDKITEFVKITIKDHGDIIVRLRSDIAPITVQNFQTLVADGFYDDLTFHRIIKNFMIQGGQNANVNVPNIKGEFSQNGVQNGLLHVRGVISMARTLASMDSASSQFFICDKTTESLDGGYASFGYVVAGMSTVDSVASVPTDDGDAPLSKVVMEKVCFVTLND